MDGPYYRCDYLGFTAISKPPTGINALQSHLKDLYLKYRRAGAGGRDASLKLIQHGMFITLLQDGQMVDELFFNFDTVNFIEAVKFATVKSSSEKKPKAIFIPVDESKGPISDKHSFSLDKSFHFLVSVSHPPLVACVVRRPKGVKALDCHLFALDSIENALHITSLVGSAQTPPGYESKAGPGFPNRGSGVFDNRGMNIDVDPRGDGNFNRGIRGDVIRPDYSDYSFYRGIPAYESVPVPTNLANENNGVLGGTRLPPTNVQRMPPPNAPYHLPGHPPGVHGSEEAMVYGLYEQPRSGALIAGPMHRIPETNDGPVAMRRPDHNSRVPTPGNRSVSTGSEQSMAGLRHQEEVRNIHHRLSQRVAQESSPSPRYQTPNPVNNDHLRHYPPTSGHQHPQQPKPPVSTPNTTHAQVSPRRDNPDFGPVFSASNLENRERVKTGTPKEDLSSQDQQTGGKPVAKVPPHLRGIKVLPSDFRNVKLKPRTEKRSDSLDSQESPYDNNNDIMKKYKAMQERTTDLDDSSDGYGNNKESVLRPDRKQESSRQHHRFSAPVYADTPPTSGHPWMPGGGGHHPSQSSYNMAAQQSNNEPASTKDAEIASMFSNMGFQNGNNRRPQIGMGFEDSLGYLP